MRMWKEMGEEEFWRIGSFEELDLF